MKYKLKSYEDNYLRIEINSDKLLFEWKDQSFVDYKRIEDAMTIYKLLCIKLDEAMGNNDEVDQV